MIHSGYNPALVVLSIAIAVFASYTALDLGGRVRGAPTRQRWGWVAGASVAMGGGIWSMHFVGMLAFNMAMQVDYDIKLTVLSLLIAISVTGAAFAWVSRAGARRRDVLISGPILGLGVASMHYTGMAAMRLDETLAYSIPIVVLSLVIAVTAATTALWLTFRQNSVSQKIVAACVMGLAVAGMHYTGMAAASFSDGMDMMPHMGAHTIALGQQNLALYVAGATFLILFLAMLASSIEQQRIQSRLHASEARFRAAAEAVGDIIWTNDEKGQMRGAQPDWEAFTGQSQAEYQGHGWAKAIHPDDVASTTTAWDAAVQDHRELFFEHRVRRADGQYRLFAVRARPVSSRDGSVREWVGVHEDITDRRDFETTLKDARDAAEDANRAKSTFIANMSHELRTPLSAIIGYSEMMLEELEDSGDEVGLATDMRKIESNARHLLGLINDVLDLSKVESGKMDVFAEAFDAAGMVRDLVTSAQSLAEKKNNALVLDLPADLGTIEQDLTKLRQILLNLLSNAAKFTENGTITLKGERLSSPVGDKIRYGVSDTGIGMSDDQVAKLFQRFQQADSSTTRKFGGTGLGLSLTKALAEMLGGTVAVASTLDVGTSFTVTVPARYVPVIEDDADAETEERLVTTPDELSRNLVLVIDDDDNQRSLMARFLHREGFSAEVSADGTTGLHLARRLKPRAILLDVMMPDVDGWAVLRNLKADPDLAGIPVIMVTFTDQRSLAASLGADDYVMKPVRWGRFKAVMDRYKHANDATAPLSTETLGDALPLEAEAEPIAASGAA